MREILFRGKRIDKDEWVEGFYVRLNEKEHRIYSGFAETDCGDYYPDFYTVDPETVGQLVSDVPDKNDKEIFEGDIVCCKQYIGGNFVDYHVVTGFVEMKYGAFGLRRGKTPHRPSGYYRPFKDWLEDYEYEVIGNIHDNPELIGGATNEAD